MSQHRQEQDFVKATVFQSFMCLPCVHAISSLSGVVLSKGQVNTRHYRFLANSGGFVWVKTQATVLYSSKTLQPEAVVCLNHILRY